MKRFLTIAALILAYASNAVAQQAPRWAGPYAGFNVGYGRGHSDVSQSGDGPLVIPNSFDVSGGEELVQFAFTGTLVASTGASTYRQSMDTAGVLGGGQAGYNWLNGKVLYGLELDFERTAIDGATSTTSEIAPRTAFSIQSEQALKWLGSLRGRLGYLASDQLAIFATAGLSFGEVESSTSISSNRSPAFIARGPRGFTCTPAVPCLAGTSNEWSVGWTVGGGFEAFLTNSISLKVEYQHVDLGTQTVRTTNVLLVPNRTGASTTTEFDSAYDIGRLGLNLHF